MKKILIFTLFCIFLTGTANAEEMMKTCGDPDYPPFTYIKRLEGTEPATGQEIKGVAPDILRMIFGELGIKVDSSYVGNWKRCQYNVENGDVDILMVAYITEERKKYAVYTETPLAQDPQAVFVWKGKEFKFEKWDDLKGKRAGLPLGSSVGKEFDEFLEKNTVVERVPEYLNNYKKMELGRIDFEPGGLYAGLIRIKKLGYEGKVVPLSNPINTESLYLPISKKSKYLKYLPELEKGLKKLSEDGTVERLIKEHIDKYSKDVDN